MNEDLDKIEQLSKKLNELSRKQDEFSNEIEQLRLDILELRAMADTESEIIAEGIEAPVIIETVQLEESISQEPEENIWQGVIDEQKEEVSNEKSNLEKFIGENLINKIGIVITIIGIAIGSKYSIEHNLISPVARIILGYASGLALLALGFKLRTKYENYSAVLVGGAIAIFYFISYFAYSFYSLFPQGLAFGLMLLFTVFSIISALSYNRQIIALIGLVGAYAVPFLLSSGSGQLGVLFSYMLIVNIGILFLSFKKYWKLLFNAAFVFTWLIYFSWYGFSSHGASFGVSLFFLFAFFIVFYACFLSYKLLKNEQFTKSDIVFLLSNSFLFYGFGYHLLDSSHDYDSFLGLFTLTNALLHFAVSYLLYKQKLADKNLFYLVMGLVLSFITITIPVQLEGSWITLFWIFEALILFWIGRTKGVGFYEKLSYPLMFLAFISLVIDWYSSSSIVYDKTVDYLPFVNLSFLSSTIFILAMSAITYIQRQAKWPSNLNAQMAITNLMTYFIPVLLVVSIYISIRLEIANYWDSLSNKSELDIMDQASGYSSYIWNVDLKSFKSIWIINYSLLFASILSVVNIKFIRNSTFAMYSLLTSLAVMLVFLLSGLYDLSELREHYINQFQSEYYNITNANIYLRYISYLFAAVCVYASALHIKQGLLKVNLQKQLEMAIYVITIWIASSELINCLDLFGFTDSYKLGMSLLWGSYALFLIVIGIWKKKKYLRLGAIILFGVTLVKLFLYDISDLDTLSKTIVFVLLGVLLLVISFLYNKYKHLIADEIKE